MTSGIEELVPFFNCIGLLKLVEDKRGVNSYDEDIIGATVASTK